MPALESLAARLIREMSVEGLTVVRIETLRLLVEAAEVGAAHVEGGDYRGATDSTWVASVRAAIESTRVGP